MIGPLFALLLLGAPPASVSSPAAGPIEVIAAEEVEYDVAKDRGVARGGVVLRRGLVVIRADRATYDGQTGEVDADGHAFLTEPGRTVAAAKIHAVLDGPYEAHDVVAFLKDGPLDLSQCKTFEEARTTGRNRARIRSETLRGEGGKDRFSLGRTRITLCDCGSGPPSWELVARGSTVQPGEGAWLYWPVLYVTPRLPFVGDHVRLPVFGRPLPVMALPVAYLPLGERQSGLLMPQLTSNAATGWGLSQPLYLTLGRSWDATITANHFFGPGDVAKVRGLGALKGSGVDLELRWAPAEGVSGIARLTVAKNRLALAESWPIGVDPPSGNARIAFVGVHDHRFSDLDYLKVNLRLVGDPLYVQTFTSDALLRAIEYQRSGIGFTHRADDVLLEADAAHLVPLANLDAGSAVGRPAPFGAFGADLSTFHRLPAASATLLPIRLGPGRLEGSAGLARFAPLRGVTGDEGADGMGEGGRGWPMAGGWYTVPFRMCSVTPSGAACDATERDGIWQETERLATTRLALRGRLSAPFVVAEAVSVEPWISGTALGYAFESDLDPRATARAVGGLVMSTRIARTFSSGLRHAITPRVEWRAGTSQAGPAIPNFAYDELDVALPRAIAPPVGVTQPIGVTSIPQRSLSAIPGGFHQLQLSVRNRLTTSGRPISFDLSAGQDVDIGAGRLAETWVQTGLTLGPLTANGTARFYGFGATRPAGIPRYVNSAGDELRSALDDFTLVTGSVTVADGRGDNLHAGFLSVAPGGSPRLMAGLEPIFDLRPIAFSPVAQGSLGATVRWSGATVTYDALYYARELPSAPCQSASTAPHFYQHQASVVWDSPCRCWRAGVMIVKNECNPSPQLGFTVDLSAIGGGSFGR